MGCKTSKAAVVHNPSDINHPSTGGNDRANTESHEKRLEIAMKVKRRQKNVFVTAPDVAGNFSKKNIPKSPETRNLICK